jgi:TonB-dependent SusC/RagA subfamily outer membrane receptor
MKKSQFLLALTALILLAMALPQGEGFLKKLEDKLSEYQRRVPEEKLYLQLDKPFYKPGDVIWLSGYLVNGADHKPSETSNIAYVELLDPKGNVSQKLELAASEGRLQGNFTLDESAPGGLYTVRAHTVWQQNFGEEAYFTKDVQVQRIVAPRLLLTLDFERDGYGPDDKVTAKLKARSLTNEPIANTEFNFTASLQGNKFLKETATTNGDGQADITFELPAELSSADGLLNVQLTYKGRQESVSRSIPIILQKIDLQFFPEGGDMVAGLNSKVAFKALNEWGKAVDVEGIILDERQNEVATFTSYHKGMSAFSLKPKKQGTYYAKITKPVALDSLYQLPSALPNGYGLSIEKLETNELEFKVYNPLDKPVFLVGQVHGKLYYSEKLSSKAGYSNYTISTDQFPIGIARFTLFDHQELPRSERLVFLNKDRQLKVELETDKEQYNGREKVELKIRTYDEHNIPVPASLSLSVVDDKIITYADDKQDNILSHLLMSSELKGKIEEPNFYFDPEEPKAEQALDYVLMTHGWRRYAWEEVLQPNYTVSFYPENEGSLSGRVINRQSGEGVDAEVTLIELAHRKRSVQLRTKEDGSFLFLNIDAGSPIQLFARSRDTEKQDLNIVLDSKSQGKYQQLGGRYKLEDMSAVNESVAVAAPPPIRQQVEVIEMADQEEIEEAMIGNFSLQEDIEQLNEVVVTGYIVDEQKQALSYSTVKVERIEDNPLTNNQAALQQLSGKIAGVQVTQSNGAAGSASRVVIRGSSSLTGTNQPLFIVDGIPVEMQSPTDLNPNDISSVTVIKGAQATALYGSRGSNGVILINTKNGFYYPYRQQGSVPDNYASLYVKPRKFSPTQEFYSPIYDSQEPVEERTDFRETIYWNPLVTTDRRGEATLTYYNSDALTSFRITAEGIGLNGLPGRQELVYSTVQPLSLEASIPPYFLFEDEPAIPILLTNNTDQPQQATLKLAIPTVMQPTALPDTAVTLAPNSTQTVYLKARISNQAGSHTISLSLTGRRLKDKVEQTIEVLPKGFPVEVNYSGNELSKNFSFRINDPVPGSVKASFTAYPSVVENIFGGIESILRQPYGCFEQTSSATFPNVLALHFMMETDQDNPAARDKALKYIDTGYKRLIGFETKQDGFEWFGRTPPHTNLTAYGLLEFTEMAKVYSKVDTKMLERTKNWLLSRRDGKGNFTLNDRGLDGFNTKNQIVSNAYVLYAMAEAGIALSQLQKEYEIAYQEALDSKDAYRLGLMANAAFAFKQTAQAEKLISILEELASKYSVAKLPAKYSIVNSYGSSLYIETASLYTLAQLRSPTPAIESVRQAIDFIQSSRNDFGFGSTQGTVMALTALTRWAKYNKRTAESGVIALALNQSPWAKEAYAKDQQGEILLASLENKIVPGLQQVQVTFDDTKAALPYNFRANWTSYTPASSADCKVKISTKLAASQTTVGETVRLTTEIRNLTNEGIPQTLAIVGIPSGLSLQAWQLKELQEKNTFDFYEIHGNNIVFYMLQLEAGSTKTIHLDLKADVPGKYQAPASSTYLYYTPEYKNWAAGTSITINP